MNTPLTLSRPKVHIFYPRNPERNIEEWKTKLGRTVQALKGRHTRIQQLKVVNQAIYEFDSEHQCNEFIRIARKQLPGSASEQVMLVLRPRE